MRSTVAAMERHKDLSAGPTTATELPKHPLLIMHLTATPERGREPTGAGSIQLEAGEQGGPLTGSSSEDSSLLPSTAASSADISRHHEDVSRPHIEAV